MGDNLPWSPLTTRDRPVGLFLAGTHTAMGNLSWTHRNKYALHLFRVPALVQTEIPATHQHTQNKSALTLTSTRRYEILPRKNGTRKERGISLFREIPSEKTCDNAGIPGELCACGRFLKPKMNAISLQVLGATLLRRVNSFIGFSFPEIHNTSKTLTVSDPSHSSSGQLATSDRIKSDDSENMKVSEIPASAGEFTRKYARLALVKVESVYQVTNDQLQSLKEKSYRVTIRTSPALALFEALINYEPGKSSYVVSDAVRINMYRGQADCVHDPWLR
ncbi:hypothetical protein PoB_005929100 [Plakobranchus ocellatus]|uniref:Uncharacterized protein n=1 Tax=Plakobranchus ocellatus TaxID=259542 RepID=A0AAV4CBU5_9GAST|nr:hypothetical protein PoB_005929100 [Plakobranchus ocellatus]